MRNSILELFYKVSRQEMAYRVTPSASASSDYVRQKFYCKSSSSFLCWTYCGWAGRIYSRDPNFHSYTFGITFCSNCTKRHLRSEHFICLASAAVFFNWNWNRRQCLRCCLSTDIAFTNIIWRYVEVMFWLCSGKSTNPMKKSGALCLTLPYNISIKHLWNWI